MYNRDIDCFRTCALLLVMIYYVWVRFGSVAINNTVLMTIVMLGGEIGVTAFFILSRYGIYIAIDKAKKGNEYNFWEFIKKTSQNCTRVLYVTNFFAFLF